MINGLIIITTAVGMKLTSSGDDCVWLAKLISKESRNHRIFIEIVYLLTLVFIVTSAFLISFTGLTIFKSININENYFSILSSVSLILFAIFYLRTHDDDINPKKANSLSSKLYNAFYISVIGSIDEFALFIVAFSTNKISLSVLLTGTIIAGIIIILFIEGLSKIQFVLNLLEKLDVWKIIAGLGFISLAFSIYNLIWAQ